MEVRDEEWLKIMNNYMEGLVSWCVILDREDGSTAPFTSAILEDACLNKNC